MLDWRHADQRLFLQRLLVCRTGRQYAREPQRFLSREAAVLSNGSRKAERQAASQAKRALNADSRRDVAVFSSKRSALPGWRLGDTLVSDKRIFSRAFRLYSGFSASAGGPGRKGKTAIT